MAKKPARRKSTSAGPARAKTVADSSPTNSARRPGRSPDDGSNHTVRGTVTYPGKFPGVRLNVGAFDQGIGGEDRLGEAITDEKGRYRIEYTDGRSGRSKYQSRGADVFVRVHSADGALLAQSRTVRNAPPDLLLDVQ